MSDEFCCGCTVAAAEWCKTSSYWVDAGHSV